MITVTPLTCDKLTPDMLSDFMRVQAMTRKWVRNDDVWVLQDTDELREWDADKRLWVPEYLKQQIGRGGAAFGAYDSGRLVGFCCMDGCLAGNTAKYVNLTMLFVDDRCKRMGIGKQLFSAACTHAAKAGAQKLFISAIPSADTVAFYFNMGCSDAQEIIADFIDSDNDRFMEYLL